MLVLAFFEKKQVESSKTHSPIRLQLTFISHLALIPCCCGTALLFRTDVYHTLCLSCSVYYSVRKADENCFFLQERLFKGLNLSPKRPGYYFVASNC